MIVGSNRTENFQYAIRNLARAAEVQERLGREVLYLNIGDPQSHGFRPPEHVIEAVTQAARHSFTGYTHSAGLPVARNAVASYATALGAPTTAKDVFMTSGASEAADLLLSALVNVGDEVLLPAPGYPIYAAILNKLGAVPRYYKLDGSAGWQLSPDSLLPLINSRTRALVLINPNNPTGSVTPDAVTAELLQIAHERKLLVISDEVYRELCFVEQPRSASVIAEAMGLPVVTLESLSKTHLIPGWRVGWMRFTHAEQMGNLIPAVTTLADGRLCSPTITQYAVQTALEGDTAFQKSFLKEIKSRRDVAVNFARETAGLSCIVPDAAFYLMIKVEDLRGETDESFVLKLLEETGILVVHGSGFGADPRDGYFRMVYLANEKTLGNAFEEINSFLKNFHAASC